MKSWKLSRFAALFLTFSGNLFAQNLIVNGSFEQGDYSGGSYETILNGQTDITGWDVGGTGVDWHNENEMQFPQDGSLVVDFNLSGGGLSDTGTLSQTFATTVGQNYTLSFYLAGPDGQTPAFQNPREIEVQVAAQNQVFSTTASWHENLVWQQHSLVFTATGNNTTLTFSSTNGDYYWGPLLDNVSVIESVEAGGASQIPTLPLYGLVITVIGLMLVAGRRLRG